MKTWKYLLTLVVLTHSQIMTGAVRDLYRFQDSIRLQGWEAVNDGVMGGLSKGRPVRGDSGLLFSGELSLENNGGFSSIRSQQRMDLSDFEGIRMRLCGDGREYQLRLQTDARFRGWPVSYSGSFATRSNEWMEVEVPFDALNPSFRGLVLKDYPFDPAKIQLLGLMLADKKAGPFTLEVEWIQAYRKEGNARSSDPQDLRGLAGTAPEHGENALWETFSESLDLLPGWSQEGRSWVSTNGHLLLDQTPLAGKDAAIRYDLKVANVICEFFVRFDSPSQFLEVGWDLDGLASEGRSPVLRLSSDAVTKGGNPAEDSRMPQVTLAPATWHCVRIAHWGPFVTLKINGENVWKGSDKTLDNPKTGLVFLGSGKGLAIDEIRVWKEMKLTRKD